MNPYLSHIKKQKNEMHKSFINIVKRAKHKTHKNNLKFHKHAQYLMSTIKHQNEPKIDEAR